MNVGGVLGAVFSLLFLGHSFVVLVPVLLLLRSFREITASKPSCLEGPLNHFAPFCVLDVLRRGDLELPLKINRGSRS